MSHAAAVDAALALWGLAGAPTGLVAARENHVYRVEAPRGALALRLHRPGYRSDAEIASELDWMAALAARGVAVPRPVPSRAGRLLERTGGWQADMLGWIEGPTLAEALAAGAPAAPLMEALGGTLARLHAASDNWRPGPGFTRWSWNLAGLAGPAPLWGRFWENPTLGPDDAAMLARFRSRAATELERIGPRLDTGLIHADPIPDNVLLAEDGPRLIDFDDGGWGPRLFDVSTALIKLEGRPDLPALRDALLAGYCAVRPLEANGFALIHALRAASYVGWTAERLNEPEGDARNTAAIARARRIVGAWLDR